MKLTTLLEVLWASTITHRVESKFRSRGGVFVVAPPGHLKTSILHTLETQIGVSSYSDMVSNDLSEARDLIAANKIHTLIFYDFQKLYERRADTAANIIGNLRSVVDEGFTMTTIERGRSGGKSPNMRRARALLLAATTPKFVRLKLGEWRDSGFARRFLFCNFQLKHPSVVVDAILRDAPIEFSLRGIGIPANLEIPMDVTMGDESFLMDCLKHQEGDEVPLILLKKTLAVLRWKYKSISHPDDRGLQIMQDFSESLGPEGADLIVDGEQAALDFTSNVRKVRKLL